ncbi:MAG: flavoprotein, partial [bacterium]
MKVLLGITGSVATIKAPELVAALRDDGHELQVVATPHAWN